MTPESRRRALLQMKAGHAPFSYAPVRTALGDILNAQPGLVVVRPTSWAAVERKVARLARSLVEARANIDVGKLLYEYLAEQEVAALVREFEGFSLGIGQVVRYWPDAVLLVGGVPVLPCFDFRRSGGLTEVGRRFVFSIMNEKFRALSGDFAEARFVIFQLTQEPRQSRIVRSFFADGISLFSYDEIIQMAADTNRLWREILEERAEETRKTGTADSGWWG